MQGPARNTDIRALLRDNLPPIIARKGVEHFTGGLLTRKTMANYDSRGKGPADAYALGKHIVYTRDAFVDWLIDTYPVTKIVGHINAGA